MNIGRTIRVLYAEPVGDPRPGEWPVVPPATQDAVTAAGPEAASDPDAAPVDAASPRG